MAELTLISIEVGGNGGGWSTSKLVRSVVVDEVTTKPLEQWRTVLRATVRELASSPSSSIRISLPTAKHGGPRLYLSPPPRGLWQEPATFHNSQPLAVLGMPDRHR
jgi:hypothetical protein